MHRKDLAKLARKDIRLAAIWLVVHKISSRKLVKNVESAFFANFKT